jgi:hypothetical protein
LSKYNKAYYKIALSNLTKHLVELGIDIAGLSAEELLWKQEILKTTYLQFIQMAGVWEESAASQLLGLGLKDHIAPIKVIYDLRQVKPSVYEYSVVYVEPHIFTNAVLDNKQDFISHFLQKSLPYSKR